MHSPVPLVSKEYRIQKFPGKGGWWYVVIPEILQNKKAPFGWVRVRGTIDGYEIKQYKLMPMGKGKLFLPIKAEIRKTIRKKEGDVIQVILYADESPLEIPQEISECLKNESITVYNTFLSFSESEQKAYIDWIYDAKKEETRASRIVKMIERLIKRKKLYDKLED